VNPDFYAVPGFSVGFTHRVPTRIVSHDWAGKLGALAWPPATVTYPANLISSYNISHTDECVMRYSKQWKKVCRAVQLPQLSRCRTSDSLLQLEGCCRNIVNNVSLIDSLKDIDSCHDVLTTHSVMFFWSSGRIGSWEFFLFRRQWCYRSSLYFFSVRRHKALTGFAFLFSIFWTKIHPKKIDLSLFYSY